MIHFSMQIKQEASARDLIDLKKIFRLVASNWYYFVITMVVALICAFLYNTLTLPTYRVSTTLPY